MDMNLQINRLLNFALQQGLIAPEDKYYSANLLLDLLGVDEFEVVEVNETLPIAHDILENMLDEFDKKIHDYLINISVQHVHSDEMNKISKYLDTIKDYERIGDHCSNICGFYEDRYKRQLTLSEDSMQDLEQMFEAVNTMIDKGVNSIKKWSDEDAKVVSETEHTVDNMEEIFHERHTHRVANGQCSYLDSDYYDELLVNLERIGDHCKNLADTVLGKNRSKENKLLEG